MRRTFEIKMFSKILEGCKVGDQDIRFCVSANKVKISKKLNEKIACNYIFSNVTARENVKIVKIKRVSNVTHNLQI